MKLYTASEILHMQADLAVARYYLGLMLTDRASPVDQRQAWLQLGDATYDDLNTTCRDALARACEHDQTVTELHAALDNTPQ